MPVTISQQDYWDLICETRCQQKNLNHNGKFDVTWQYPEQLAQGTYREIKLRQGVELAIDCYLLHDNVIIQLPEQAHSLEYELRIAGKSTPTCIPPGQYALYGSGVARNKKCEQSAAEPIVLVSVHIKPEVFETFLGDWDFTYIRFRAFS